VVVQSVDTDIGDGVSVRARSFASAEDATTHQKALVASGDLEAITLTAKEWNAQMVDHRRLTSEEWDSELGTGEHG